jgi:predicted permease
MDTLVQDMRYGVRSLRKHRSTTIIAVICLALGIGVSTAIFSIVQAVLLRALPYRSPDQLVRFYETYAFQGKRGTGSVSTPDFIDFRSQNRSFQDMAAYTTEGRDLGDIGEPERVYGVRATANLFAVLGAVPLIGRTFAANEDERGAPRVVVLSEGIWRRRFAADRRVIGTSVRLGSDKYTVIGVMPDAFEFPIGGARINYWMPLVWRDRELESRGNHWLQVVARMRPGADSASATIDLSAIAERLARDYPDAQKDRGIQIRTLTGVVVGRVRTALLILLGAVSLVLLIACANVANLLLARAAVRRREVAVRTALGASRSRLVQQLLTESALLAFTGGVLGIGVAKWLLSIVLSLAATSIPRGDTISLNINVLIFAAVMSMLTGIAFGLVPALRSTRTDLRADLEDVAGRGGTGKQQHRTLRTLIAAELALSVVLLVGAGLLVRGFVAVMRVDPGFNPEQVLTFHASAPYTVPDTERYARFYGPVLERLRALPGVRAAGVTVMLPIQMTGMNGYFDIVGRPQEQDAARKPYAEFRAVSAGYFGALGIPILRGRDFDDTDTHSSHQVLIVNDEFARRYFPNGDAIGHQVLAWQGQRPSTIVGVVRSVRQSTIEEPPISEIYVNAAQRAEFLGSPAFVVSTTRANESLVNAARGAVRDVGPQQPLYQILWMTDVVSSSLRARRLNLVLLGVFAGLAGLLSGAGVYGVMSYAVTQRRREMGIRLAIGARPRNVVALILGDAAKVAAAGLVIGLGAAAALTKLMAAMLYGIGQHDPITFSGVALFVALLALVASAVPATRAARIDPLLAMRAD